MTDPEIKNALVIGGLSFNRTAFVRRLKGLSILGDVNEASTGQAGLEILRSIPTDCILIHDELPDGTGVGLLPGLVDLAPNAPVIVIAAKGRDDVGSAAIRMGASDFLTEDLLDAPTIERSLKNAFDRAAVKHSMKSSIQQSQKFLRTLVHDVKAPVWHIKAIAGFIDEDFGDTLEDGLRDHVQGMVKAAGKMDILLKKLDEYSSVNQVPKLAPTSLGSIARDAVTAKAELLADRKAVLQIGALPDILGHRDQLLRLFDCLLDNALMYNTAEKPEIRVRQVEETPSDFTVEVEDNGIGVPQTERSKIFDPFYRLWSESEYPGAGLGLAICRKVMGHHSGSIRCEPSTLGGSRFSMCFQRV